MWRRREKTGTALYLDGKTQKISGETVKRVQQGLERTGYVPNMAGIPLCLLAAYGFRWDIVGVYVLLNAEGVFRLVLSLRMFRKRSWMISLADKKQKPLHGNVQQPLRK